MKMTHHVLVVDDEPDILELLSIYLSMNDRIEVHTAENGEIAVEMYHDLATNGSRPGIILMDLMMPVMGGIEATRKILEYDSDAKIYVVTAYTEPDLIRDAMDAGAKDVINKMAGFPEISEMVMGVLTS
ncbi:MAG: response regulator transcription factor [Methanosarcinales archaeon]|nr:response regulator transcription factor [Methanosarcinales archaeon]